MEHHKYQGVDGIDTDLPTRIEGLLFNSVPGKMFFATFQILFYAIRPMMVRFQQLTNFHFLNIAYIFAFDYVLYLLFGPGAVVYLLASTLIAGSAIHPCAAHFFAEHYVFTGVSETYSYYGILNRLCFNVGYHNEHHDFPNIPGSRLPALRALASDYYQTLPSHESWVMVTWKFLSDPQVSAWNRVKRVHVE
jgi:sphingolipid delta-4 desaturase